MKHDGDPEKLDKRNKRYKSNDYRWSVVVFTLFLSRLVRNREAAQQFRMRQKQHIIDMESKIKLVEAENSELRTKVELLNSENKIVKDQLLYLRSFIGQAVSISMDKLPPNGQPILPKDVSDQ